MNINVQTFYTPELLSYLYTYSICCYVGMSDDDDNLQVLIDMLQLNENNLILVCYGKLINEYFKLEGKDCFSDDLPFIFVTNYNDPEVMAITGAYYFDDFIDEIVRK